MSIDLKFWRATNNYSQLELAEALGVHRVTVANWELGAHKLPDDLQAQLDKLPSKTRGIKLDVHWYSMNFAVELDYATAKEQPFVWHHIEGTKYYDLFSYNRQHLIWYDRANDRLLNMEAAFSGEPVDLSMFSSTWLDKLRAQIHAK